MRRAFAILAITVLVAFGCAACSAPSTSQNADKQEERAGQPTQESSIARPSTSGALHVQGTQLTDEHGNAVQLKGISAHGLAWFPQYVNQEAFTQFATDWNTNLMRLAMYTAESGGYCTGGDQAKLHDLVLSGVKYAKAADMYAIVDWHILSDNNPNTHAAEAIEFFSRISSELASETNVIYEICNEPNGATTWADVKAYAPAVIQAIRANDPDAVIVVGTPTWSQDVDKAAADPLQFDNLMYTLHFYAATHKDDLRAKAQAALNAGLPLFVTEFGICDASGNGAIDVDQANKWIAFLDENKISYAAWNLSNKAESSSILLPGCSKDSGFTAEDLSPSGTWLHSLLTGNGTTEAAPSPKHESDGGISYTVSSKNSWTADGKQFTQYEVALTNAGTTDASGWSVSIPLSSADFQLSDSWNGAYEFDGSTLTITNKDYNATIPAGASIADIGFIASGSATPQ